MGTIENSSQAQATTHNQQGLETTFVGASGVTWVKPVSTQPPDLSLDCGLHKKVTHALLANLGRSELIPTSTPPETNDPMKLLENEQTESRKCSERNALLYPKRLSQLEETIFMTPRKRAINPSYLRTHVANMFRTVCEGDIDSVARDARVSTDEGSGGLRLFRLGGDRPGKPRHRLDLWQPNMPTSRES
ncbi:hypothetical protein HOY82DRAFT_595773 [Tuber indicum]|nr:hypothetical protein HOY82DRAFT_595773 [Tuber indicum]